MTLGEAYRRGRKILKEAGTENAAFDAGCLFRRAFGLDLEQRILRSGEPADSEKTRQYCAMARERAQGRPLQYILGEWPFLGMTLEVGEGVLIPREETELLVRTAAGMLADVPSPRGADLCAGSGAVGLGLLSLMPGARVWSVEKYPAALRYLKRNALRSGLPGLKIVRADVLEPDSAALLPELDCLISNPPYVRDGEIAGLQPEVRREPREALSGGPDGLRFYRAFREIWLKKLKPGGMAAFEVGEGEAGEVLRIFAGALEDLRVRKDLNGIARVVSGRKPA